MYGMDNKDASEVDLPKSVDWGSKCVHYKHQCKLWLFSMTNNENTDDYDSCFFHLGWLKPMTQEIWKANMI